MYFLVSRHLDVEAFVGQVWSLVGRSLCRRAPTCLVLKVYAGSLRGFEVVTTDDLVPRQQEFRDAFVAAFDDLPLDLVAVGPELFYSDSDVYASAYIPLFAPLLPPEPVSYWQFVKNKLIQRELCVWYEIASAQTPRLLRTLDEENSAPTSADDSDIDLCPVELPPLRIPSTPIIHSSSPPSPVVLSDGTDESPLLTPIPSYSGFFRALSPLPSHQPLECILCGQLICTCE